MLSLRGRESPRRSFGLVMAMVAMVAVPMALTLHTVRVSSVVDLPEANPSPYGYTVSLLLFVIPILVIGWNGTRPADHNERRVKGVPAALALSLIAAFVWAHRDFRSSNAPMARWRMHRRCAPIAPGINPVLPMKKADNGERPSLEVVARALRRLLFVTSILLALAFAVVCYAELLGVVRFD